MFNIVLLNFCNLKKSLNNFRGYILVNMLSANLWCFSMFNIVLLNFVFFFKLTHFPVQLLIDELNLFLQEFKRLFDP
jgi:hypothetical protein